MMLSEICVREFYAYYNLPFDEAAEQDSGEIIADHEKRIQESARRYGKFESRMKQLLEKAGLQQSAVHFLYVILPALYRAASETYEGPATQDEEVRRHVEGFLKGYETSELPFHLITVVIKTLEKTLFNRVEYKAPSLDIGIGDGHASDFILEPNKITVGSEPSLNGLLSAKRYARHEHFVGVDANCIPFQNETFNTVSLIHSIDHVKDRLVVLREAARVLRPGGTLVLSDASEYIEEMMPMAQIYRLFGYEELASDAFKYFLDMGGERVEFYSPEKYQQVLSDLGFEDIRGEFFMASQVAKLAYAQFELFLVMGGQGLAKSENAKFREFFFDCVRSTIVPLISADQELCQREGKGLNIFVTAKKRGTPANGASTATEGASASVAEAGVLNHLSCPRCGGRVALGSETCRCLACGLDYPVVESMPLMVPFYAEGLARIKETLSDSQYAGRNRRGKLSRIKRQLVKVPYLYQLVRYIKTNLPKGQ
jgi:ubiquinone/menaquinone biosynthesis C-methylase UbiE/uncharacterized protein YbaR (Trm112 family)